MSSITITLVNFKKIITLYITVAKGIYSFLDFIYSYQLIPRVAKLRRILAINYYIIPKSLISQGFTFEKWWYLGGTSLLLLVQNVVIKETSGTLPVPGKCK